jgi:hypothetical protein
VLSSNAPLPSQTAEIPAGRAAPTDAIGYSFGGVPLPLILGFLLAAVPGSRRIRRYMERLFTEVLAT